MSPLDFSKLRVSKNILTNVIYFFLYFQEVHWGAFTDLRILVELDLSHNNLTHLDPETFSGNDRLQTLTLSHNKITSISPYVFPPLKHLKTVDLSHNFIDEIQRNTFENLGNSVEALNMDNNRLGSLREEVFLPLTNLKSLQVINGCFRFQQKKFLLS